MKARPKAKPDNPWRRRFLALLGIAAAWLPFFPVEGRDARRPKTSWREADWYRRGDGSA